MFRKDSEASYGHRSIVSCILNTIPKTSDHVGRRGPRAIGKREAKWARDGFEIGAVFEVAGSH